MEASKTAMSRHSPGMGYYWSANSRLRALFRLWRGWIIEEIAYAVKERLLTRMRVCYAGKQECVPRRALTQGTEEAKPLRKRICPLCSVLIPVEAI